MDMTEWQRVADVYTTRSWTEEYPTWEAYCATFDPGELNSPKRKVERRRVAEFLSDAGLPQRQIATAMRCSRSAITTVLSEYPFPPLALTPEGKWYQPVSRTPQRARERRATLVEMAEAGYSKAQIARELGVREGHVMELAKRAGATLSAESVHRFTHRFDPTGACEEACHSLEAIATSLTMAGEQMDRLNLVDVGYWVDSMSRSTREINRFIKRLKEGK